MIQVLFGDDEHTAKDGPYARALKARKWIYLSAAAATILGLGLYDADAAARTFPLVAGPTWLFGQAVLGGLAYLLLQYGLLLMQLATTYDLILSERLAFRRQDELAAAFDRMTDAERSLAQSPSRSRRDDLESLKHSLGVMIVRTEETKAQLEDQRRALAETLSRPGVPRAELKQSISNLESLLALQEGDQRAYRNAIGRLEEDPSGQGAKEADAEAWNRFFELKEAYQQLRHEDAAARFAYKLNEMAIDFARVVTPLVVGVGAALKLALSGVPWSL